MEVLGQGWRRHPEGKAVGLWSLLRVFGRPPQQFRKGRQGRNRGLVSSVLQIIDIPQLKLSTFTGGGRNSDAEEAAPAVERIRIRPRQPTTCRPWSRSTSPRTGSSQQRLGRGLPVPERVCPQGGGGGSRSRSCVPSLPGATREKGSR